MVSIEGYWLINGEKSLFCKRDIRLTVSQVKTFTRRVRLYFGSEIIFVKRDIPSTVDYKVVREYLKNPDEVSVLVEKYGVSEWYIKSLVAEYKRMGRLIYV